jgi:sortase A
MSARASRLWWLERTLFITGFVLALWALISAAQSRFYASLPVPTPVLTPAVLPGEDSGIRDGVSVAASTHGAVRPGDWVARLEAPSVGLTATVIEGSSDRMLARAAGHIEYTPLPGGSGNVGIAGHRDTTFRAVRNLKVGELLTLQTRTGEFAYRVQKTFVVDPTDVYVLDPTAVPSLTLVTCYPFTFIGHAPQRYIVRAVRADGR